MTWRWYIARTRAMSMREVLWRGANVAVRPMRQARQPTTRPQWDNSGWLDTLSCLVEPQRQSLISDANRLADGQLEFWGRASHIDLRAPDWLADPRDGARFPSGSWRRWRDDPKPLWELHRQQHLLPLAAGAMLAEREDWTRLAVDHLLHWVQCNPPTKGPAWISGYETAHRLAGWTFALPLLRPAITSRELACLDDAFLRQCGFVAARPSRFSSANNHRICELVGLLAAARIGAADLRWNELWRDLEREAERQTYDDGGSREQASGYFLYVLELLWVAGVLAQSAGRSLGRVEERLDAMLEWLDLVADDQGEPPPVGDDAEDRMLRLEYFQPRSATAIATRVRKLLGYEHSEIARESAIMEASGYAVLRTGRVRIVFDVGELGFGSLAAHGHADALSVLVDLEGRSLLRDSGTGTYAPASVRERFRATPAHNTVVVGGGSQAEALGPHLWGHRFRTSLKAVHLSDAYDSVRACHDGYRGTLHTRTVVLIKPDLVVVLDLIASDRRADVTLVWQPWGEPMLAVSSSPPSICVDDVGPWSPRYDAVQEARRLTWTATGERVVFATVMSLAEREDLVTLHEDEEGATVVEVGQPKRVRIVERWTGPPTEVQL